MECRNTPIERPPMLGYKQSKFDKKDSVFCYFILCGVIPDIDGFLQILTRLPKTYLGSKSHQ